MVHSHGASNQDSWLFSRTGLVTVGIVAILGFLLYTGHSAHLLGFAPFLLLLACPLMHIFMHGGHRSNASDDSQALSEDSKSPENSHAISSDSLKGEK